MLMKTMELTQIAREATRTHYPPRIPSEIFDPEPAQPRGVIASLPRKHTVEA